eukprot:15718002-Heterocapsa_arctica.AAC.1
MPHCSARLAEKKRREVEYEREIEEEDYEAREVSVVNLCIPPWCERRNYQKAEWRHADGRHDPHMQGIALAEWGPGPAG